MRLKRLVILNHARLQDIDLHIRTHLILIGPNDVGKSSILRCLNLALGLSTSQLYGALSQSDLREVAVPMSIEVTFEELSIDELALFPDAVDGATQTPNDLTIRLEVSAGVDDEAIGVRRYLPHDGYERSVSRDQLAGIKWKFISASHAASRDIRDDGDSTLNEILSAVNLGAERASFDELTAQLQGKLDHSQTLESVRKSLATQISRALPNELGTEELSFRANSELAGDPLADVKLRIKQANVEKSLSEQSDGMRALFALAIHDLASLRANIVCIDEPEIHLHPSGQRSVARLLLKNATNQKILATHSEDIVGMADPEWIVSVQADGHVRQPARGFLTGDERLVAHWWVRGRLEPLTARYVLIVEGISDAIIVGRAAEVLGCDLDRLGVTIVPLEGAGGVGMFTRLFGASGFNIGYSVLIDDDAKDKTAKALKIAVSDLNRNNVFICPVDLEQEYVAALEPILVHHALKTVGFFPPNMMAHCAIADPNGSPTVDEVASFCRRSSSYKVNAALSIVDLLTGDGVRRQSTIIGLLRSIPGTSF